MRGRDLLTFCISFSKTLLLDQGMQVHGSLLKMGFGYGSMLSNDHIAMYWKHGRMDVEVLTAVFDRNVVLVKVRQKDVSVKVR